MFVVILSETTALEDTGWPSNLIKIGACPPHMVLIHSLFINVTYLLSNGSSMICLFHFSIRLQYYRLHHLTQILNFTLLLSINVQFMLLGPLIVGLAIHLFFLFPLFGFLLSNHRNFRFIFFQRFCLFKSVLALILWQNLQTLLHLFV